MDHRKFGDFRSYKLPFSSGIFHCHEEKTEELILGDLNDLLPETFAATLAKCPFLRWNLPGRWYGDDTGDDMITASVDILSPHRLQIVRFKQLLVIHGDTISIPRGGTIHPNTALLKGLFSSLHCFWYFWSLLIWLPSGKHHIALVQRNPSCFLFQCWFYRILISLLDVIFFSLLQFSHPH